MKATGEVAPSGAGSESRFELTVKGEDMTESQKSKAKLASGSKAAVGRLITRHVRPENIGDALQRSPDDIKVVVDFGTGA